MGDEADDVDDVDAIMDAILRRAALPAGVRIDAIAADPWNALIEPIVERAFADRRILSREDYLDEETREGAARLEAREGDRVLHHRYGFYAESELVGFYEGRQHGSAYEMRGTAIVPEWQRRGIYAALLPQVIDAARVAGFLKIVSRHHLDDNAILIAKLSRGFVIGSFVTALAQGLLVELVYYLHESARARHQQIIKG